MFEIDTTNEEDYNFSQIINNAKVTDHHAIIPTMEAANINFDSAPGEKNILMMVASRLLTAVAKKHEYAETVVTVDCEGEIFTAKGKTVLSEGWKAIEDVFISVYGNKKGKSKDSKEENALPNLAENQQYTAAANLKEGFTSPPKPFTEDTLLSAMENATDDDMQDNFQPERTGIGTPATRAEIIETLLKREYVIRKDKQILPTDKGIGVIKILPDTDSVKSPLLTALWENDLKRVEMGEISADEFNCHATRKSNAIRMSCDIFKSGFFAENDSQYPAQILLCRGR
jgi:DNA topoisomerase-3